MINPRTLMHRLLACSTALVFVPLSAALAAAPAAAPDKSPPAQKAPTIRPPAADDQMPVTVGKSQVLSVGSEITKVSITNPEIADVAVVSKKDVLINGKKPGTTTLIVWTQNSRLSYDVLVRADANLLRATLERALKVSGLTVEITGDAVILIGRVNTTSQIKMAEQIASGFAPKVINLLSASNIQQVQVNVQVVELNKNAASELGVKWGTMYRLPSGEDVLRPDESVVATMKRPAGVDQPFFGIYERIAARLKFLESNGDAKILAKPNLVAVSGGKADFLVGGEIPIPMAQQLQTVTFEWKPYGIKLAVEPRVLEDGRISMKVSPEVSTLDYNNAVRLTDFLVPAISSRRASTEVILAPGQGIAIGGLMQNIESKTIERVPVLGHIPIIGELFKSTRFQKNETELAILVQPEFVGP
jgi:pilus assembly protein CpaC